VSVRLGQSGPEEPTPSAPRVRQVQTVQSGPLNQPIEKRPPERRRRSRPAETILLGASALCTTVAAAALSVKIPPFVGD
jgi:hypothetical protein